jgi:hypothetical protein
MVRQAHHPEPSRRAISKFEIQKNPPYPLLKKGGKDLEFMSLNIEIRNLKSEIEKCHYPFHSTNIMPSAMTTLF